MADRTNDMVNAIEAAEAAENESLIERMKNMRFRVMRGTVSGGWKPALPNDVTREEGMNHIKHLTGKYGYSGRAIQSGMMYKILPVLRTVGVVQDG